MKQLLTLILLSSISFTIYATTIGLPYKPQPVPILYGVYSVNGQPVTYLGYTNPIPNTPEGFLAVVGSGMLKGECYHDGSAYAKVKGTATCPGYFSVFPSIPDSVTPLVLRYGNQFNLLHATGSPECKETVVLFDPVR